MKDENPRDDAGSSAPSAGGAAEVTVGSLMEERRRYELWLDALNARRAETPKHVFARVHADYTTRLEQVVEKLAGQVGGLRAELTTLATRIASLEEQQHRARDERAEAELRSHVGEISAEEWTAAAKKADDLIADLERQHASATDALRRTREFLADAERPATPHEPLAAVAAPAAPSGTRAAAANASVETDPVGPDIPEVPPRGTTNVPVQPAAAVPRLRPLPGRDEGAARPANGEAIAGSASEPASPEPATAGNGRAGRNFDELAFLSSIVDESAPGAAPAARPEPASTAAANVKPVARPAPPPSRNPFARKAQEKIINNDGAAGPRIESRRVGASDGLAGNVSGNHPIVLRDKSTEGAKTLKCGECGAANYPTEWYCERCGAELASM